MENELNNDIANDSDSQDSANDVVSTASSSMRTARSHKRARRTSNLVSNSSSHSPSHSRVPMPMPRPPSHTRMQPLQAGAESPIIHYIILGIVLVMLIFSATSLAFSLKTYRLVAGDDIGTVGAATAGTAKKAAGGEVQLKADDPAKGGKNAAITIIEYSDFECPFCGRAAPTVKQVLSTYGDKVRVVYRDFPLSFHPNAMNAAIAGNCAHEQDKFWEYHDVLFQNQNSLTVASLKEYAKQLGLNTAQFDDCLDTQKYLAAVQDDMKLAQQDGLQGTPHFMINGQPLSGAQPFEAFKQIIDAQLAK